MMNENKKRVLMVILVVFSLLMFLFLIYGLNKPHIFPFGDSFKFNRLKSIAYNNEIGIAVDSQGERLIFFDKDKNIIKLHDTNAKGSIINVINNISIFGDTYYVLGAKTFNNGKYIDSEALLAFDKKGNKIDERIIADYDERDFVTTSKYQSFLVKKDCFYFTFYDADERSLGLVCYDIQKDCIQYEKKYPIEEKIYRSLFNESLDVIIAVGRSKQSYIINTKENEIKQVSYDKILDLVNSLISFGKNDLEGVSFDSTLSLPISLFDRNNNYLNTCIVDSKTNTGLIINNSGKEVEKISELGYSVSFVIENVLFFFSVLYLFVLILICLVYFLKQKFKEKKIVPFVIICFIAFVSIYYTMNVRYFITKSYNENIRVQSEQLVQTISIMYEKKANLSLDEFQKLLANFAKAYGINNSYYYNLYEINENNEVLTVVDSMDECFSGIQVSFENDVINKLANGENVYGVEEDTIDSIKICNYSLFNDKNGKPLGVIEVGYLNKNLLTTEIEYCLELSINLLVILIVVFVSLTAFPDIGKNMECLITRNKCDYEGKMIDAACPYKMLLIIITHIDSVILVLVSESLCENLDPALKVMLIALPMTANDIGGVIGTIVFNIFNNKIGKRTMTSLGSIISIISLVLIIFAIRTSNLYLFVMGKFISGFVLSGVFFGISDFMPLYAKTKEAKQSIYDSLTRVEIAGSVLTVVIGGYLSQYLSFSAIYAFGIVMTVLLFLLCLITFSNTKKIPNASKEVVRNENYYWKCWKFLCSPIMLVYFIFLVFPRALLKGYGSYLFPLYSTNAGLSVVLLSNLSVLSKTFTYGIIDYIKAILKPFSKVSVTIVFLLFIAICFMCFLISPNIYWAIIVLFLNDLVNNIVSPAMSVYQIDKVNDGGVDMEQTTSDIGIVKSVVYAFKSPTLSFILSLGYNYACAALGVLTAVAVTIFGLFNRESIKSKD